MMKFIADFVLDSDLILPEDTPMLTWTSDEFNLVVRNDKQGFTYCEEALSAELTFEADDIDEAKEKSQDILATILNSLVWVTSSRFKQARLVRVVDWSPGKTMRDALFFTEAPQIAVPLPLLSEELILSAAELHRTQKESRSQSALRWFRLGVAGDGIEEQFTYFWFALETAAEALKQPGKVTSKCQICDSDLYCSECKVHPLHRRFAADAIRDVIIGSFEDESEGGLVFKTLTKIRHTLMHGRRIDSISEGLAMDATQATNALSQIARMAILRMGNYSDCPTGKMNLNLVEKDDIVRNRLVMTARVQTVFGSDPDKPILGDRSGFRASVRYPGQPEEE